MPEQKTYSVVDSQYYKIRAAELEVMLAQTKLEVANMHLMMAQSKLDSLMNDLIREITDEGKYHIAGNNFSLSETDREVVLVPA